MTHPRTSLILSDTVLEDVCKLRYVTFPLQIRIGCKSKNRMGHYPSQRQIDKALALSLDEVFDQGRLSERYNAFGILIK